MAYRTVQRLADAARPEDLFQGQWQNRRTKLDDFKPYLNDRWAEGCTNAWTLWRRDQDARLPRRLRRRPRLPPAVPHLTDRTGRPATIAADRRRVDPDPPRRPTGERATQAEVSARALR
ncbi:hypothetical protein Slala02_31710 [Streptomyces lavendulae subsp. lavendulae]|nr:hypothetical protein Slala01_34980 [Streptomyces lavendulae subsp. lavendulae]GLX27351.1 hypothetical protein Slala02_31710 [Streptomyces lavendulae subsp. lavendulae]